ncbi:MAG: hypothetical protein H8E63_08395, partial [Proteobacteria bacterium]|nr:hypothetical protein [Pseudomonadota bacterium]
MTNLVAIVLGSLLGLFLGEPAGKLEIVGTIWVTLLQMTVLPMLMNPNPTEFLTAQANAFIHNGVVRDFITSTFPGDTTADFNVVSNTNLSSTCNAFFNGSSTNFYVEGGGCSNTSFSNVVAHELGHWLNVRYNTGNGSDGMGEG